MVNRFYFDGKSSRDFGILIDEAKPFGAPEKNVEKVKIPGRSGSLIIDHGNWENFTLKYSCGIIGNVEEKLKAIKKWLYSNSGYRILTDDYIGKDYFRLASFSDGLDVDKQGNIATFDIEFDCKPFLYRHDGEKDIEIYSSEIGSGLILLNYEAFATKPLITIYGSGNCALKINNEGISTVIDAEQRYVTIDTYTMNAYKDDTNKNSETTISEKIWLSPGENNITINSNIGKIIIKPRWYTI